MASQSDTGIIEPAPAVLVSCSFHVLPSQLLIAELFFDVPLDYHKPQGETIRLFARAAFKHDQVTAPTGSLADSNKTTLLFSGPWLAYLEGGPGAGNREPQDIPITRLLLNRGYHLLYMDYRGTGMSTTITADTLVLRGSVEQQVEYLRLFRADSIVRDLEAVRKCLTGNLPAAAAVSTATESHHQPWSIMGQSFGGFVSLTYLSFYGHGLREVFLAGGLAPVNKTPDEVYRATYRKAEQRNAAYFNKYPEDIDNLQKIAAYLGQQPRHGVPLPSGGLLTFHRVLTFGHAFGFHGGLDTTHAIILRMHVDLERFGFLTRPTMVSIEQYFPLDTLPLYGVLHEPIYCFAPGVASRWSALRMAAEFEGYGWLQKEVVSPEDLNSPLLFSCEMIYPFMFDTYPELLGLKQVADALANYDHWETLYDEQSLANNKVPVYAISYIDDLYVDYELAKETARKVGNMHVYETNRLYHNAIRSRPDDVIAHLFCLRDDPID